MNETLHTGAVKPSPVTPHTSPLTLEEIRAPEFCDAIQRLIAKSRAENDVLRMRSLVFQARCQQAAAMGLRRMEIGEIAEMLVGKQNFKTYSPSCHMPFSNLDLWKVRGTRYAHRLSQNTSHDSSDPLLPVTSLTYGKRFFNLLGTAKTLLFADHRALVTPMPGGVSTTLDHMRSQDVFSNFNVMAPEAHFHKPDAFDDPILVGTIFHEHYPNHDFLGQSHWFLAKWPD